jgi:outer membrane protein TolC
MKEAKGAVANSTNLLRDTQDEVTLEVEQALFAVQDARDRVRVANQTLAEAQEAFTIALRRYNASVSPLIELSDAQTALTQAESNQVNALYDYNTAEAELDRALGRYANYKP